MTLTLGIGGTHPLLPARIGVDVEITNVDARWAEASRVAVPRRSARPSSMTIASTCAGIPCGGQTNKRAVATTNTTITTDSAIAKDRQRRWRRAAGRVFRMNRVIVKERPQGLRTGGHFEAVNV
jgi:CelD/BcsL family acetyltransferase involved in cellulose biosynthesis